MSEQIEIVRQVARQFVLEFIESPYLCYCEHGLHALFFTKLYDALPIEQRYATWKGQKVCVIQKEYPTATSLGKSQRQHWDIAVLKTPLEPVPDCRAPSYDCFKVAVAVEFGMNETKDHLTDDINRLSYAIKDGSVAQGLIIHLYRLSPHNADVSSDRDWRPNSGRILAPEKVTAIPTGKSIEILYGSFNGAEGDKPTMRVWLSKEAVK
jgi:hypothetical protein